MTTEHKTTTGKPYNQLLPKRRPTLSPDDFLAEINDLFQRSPKDVPGGRG